MRDAEEVWLFSAGRRDDGGIAQQQALLQPVDAPSDHGVSRQRDGHVDGKDPAKDHVRVPAAHPSASSSHRRHHCGCCCAPAPIASSWFFFFWFVVFLALLLHFISLLCVCVYDDAPAAQTSLNQFEAFGPRRHDGDFY